MQDMILKDQIRGHEDDGIQPFVMLGKLDLNAENATVLHIFTVLCHYSVLFILLTMKFKTTIGKPGIERVQACTH